MWMYWAAIAVLFVLVVVLWVQLRRVTSWAGDSYQWMQKHYNHHLKYFQQLGDPHPHPDWLGLPVNGGEGPPPPFP